MLFALPPEPTGAAWGYSGTGKLAAFAPRVPHVGVGVRLSAVAGDPGRGLGPRFDILFRSLVFSNAEAIIRDVGPFIRGNR